MLTATRRSAGPAQDATSLIDSIHPWVNVQALLQACYVGRLVASARAVRPAAASLAPPTAAGPDSSAGAAPMPVHRWRQSDTEAVVYVFRAGVDPADVVLDADAHGCTLSLPDQAGRLVLRITFAGAIVPDAASVRVQPGSIELCVRKRDAGLWADLGTLTAHHRPDPTDPAPVPVTLAAVAEAARDTSVYRFVAATPIHVGLCHHVVLRIGGDTDAAVAAAVARPYTPTAVSADGLQLEFIIKRYATGRFTTRLAQLRIGDRIACSSQSAPAYQPALPDAPAADDDVGLRCVGAMEAWLPEARCIALVCGGTGITPMLRLLRFLASDGSDGGRNSSAAQVLLINTNTSREDIVAFDELEALRGRLAGRLRIVHILSGSPPDNWTGAVGRVDADFLRQHLPAPGPWTCVLICGRPSMVREVATQCLALGHAALRCMTFL